MNRKFEDYRTKIQLLNRWLWEQRVNWPDVERWLSNFTGKVGDAEKEHLHALHLLSQFMFFGSREVREMLRSLFRDLYRYPIVEKIRRANGDTLDADLIKREFEKELVATKFVGMGNPSESGVHLLYYFRQENYLSKEMFVESRLLLPLKDQAGAESVRQPDIKRFVFIDDINGSGTQAKSYSQEVLKELLRVAPQTEVAYYSLFATSRGLDAVKKETLFGNNAGAVFVLDDSFKCFDPVSRFFSSEDAEIDREFCKAFAAHYGAMSFPNHPLGYKDGQLLIGFHHNTPDNTLPIIWADEVVSGWKAIFRRYPKYEST